MKCRDYKKTGHTNHYKKNRDNHIYYMYASESTMTPQM